MVALSNHLEHQFINAVGFNLDYTLVSRGPRAFDAGGRSVWMEAYPCSQFHCWLFLAGRSNLLDFLPGSGSLVRSGLSYILVTTMYLAFRYLRGQLRYRGSR